MTLGIGHAEANVKRLIDFLLNRIEDTGKNGAAAPAFSFFQNEREWRKCYEADVFWYFCRPE
jgi:hypothetical protein